MNELVITLFLVYLFVGVMYLWHVSDDGDNNLAGLFVMIWVLFPLWPIVFVIRLLRRTEPR